MVTTKQNWHCHCACRIGMERNSDVHCVAKDNCKNTEHFLEDSKSGMMWTVCSVYLYGYLDPPYVPFISD